MNKKVKVEGAVLGILLLCAGTIWAYSHFQPLHQPASAARAVAEFKALGVENAQIHWDRVAVATFLPEVCHRHRRHLFTYRPLRMPNIPRRPRRRPHPLRSCR